MYVTLLLTFLKIGALSIGGGYGAISIIYSEVVMNNSWLSKQQFIDVLTIAEMTPGPIAINAATFVGVKTVGILGGIVATLGSVTIPFILVILLKKFYGKYKNYSKFQEVLKGLKSVVLALVISVCITLLRVIFQANQQTIDTGIKIILLFGSLILITKFKIKPIGTMLLTGAIYTFCKIVIL